MYFIKDQEFIRGNCPMTKEEIRILSIARLEINENSKILDVGAGTGTISVQAAINCTKGFVTAIERDKDAIEIIKQNINKFNVRNIKLIESDALKALEGIKETFDSIFIGGSGGDIEEIIVSCDSKLKNQGLMVLNFITINNLYKSMNKLMELGYNVNSSQINVSKTSINKYMMTSNNGVFIIWGKKSERGNNNNE